MYSQTDNGSRPQRLLRYVDALREAVANEMEVDPRVFVFGLDVDDHKAILGSTRGLQERFGKRPSFQYSPFGRCDDWRCHRGRDGRAQTDSCTHPHGFSDAMHESTRQYGSEGALHVWRHSEGAYRRAQHYWQVMGTGSAAQPGPASSVFMHIPGLKLSPHLMLTTPRGA